MKTASPESAFWFAVCAESIANGRVAPNGKWFAGVDYGKISRSREIIAYSGATDAMGHGPASPGDGNALFPDGQRHVGSHRLSPTELVRTFYRRPDGARGRSRPVPGKSGGGVSRIDPAPRWNRASDTVLAPRTGCGRHPAVASLVRLAGDEKPPSPAGGG